MSGSFPVRVEGDQVMHRAIKSLSAEDGVSISQAVATALRQYWGERLSEKMKVLCAEGGLKIVQTDEEKTSHD